MDKRIRMVIEFDIDSEACEEYGVDPKEILESIGVYDDDVIDGFEIYPQAGYDLSEVFCLCDPVLISKEFVSFYGQ